MDLLSTYSHYCGVQPLPPFIWEEYYSIPLDNYVVIQAGAGMPSKQYDLWDYVLEHVKMKKIQIGGKDDPKLNVDIDLRGLTSWNQTAYILRRTRLFLGCDSVCNHMASAFGVPRIALFGATSPLSCGGVYDRTKAVELVPQDMCGCAATCHGSVCIQANKCINTIKPELVLKYIEGFLGKGSIVPVEILHIGKFASSPLIEWLPRDCGQSEFDLLRRFVGAVNVRVSDSLCDLEALSNLCNACNLKYIFILPPCDASRFDVSLAKTEQIFVFVDKENVEDGIETMRQVANKGYKTRLLSLSPSSDFNQFKLSMIDFPPMEQLQEDHTKSLDGLCGKSYCIKTARKILAQNNKFFLTINDAKQNKNAIEIEEDHGNLVLEPEHLFESAYFSIRQYKG